MFLRGSFFFGADEIEPVFIERTKVNRKIKKSEKQLKEADTTEAKKEAQKTLTELNIDLNYITVSAFCVDEEVETFIVTCCPT